MLSSLRMNSTTNSKVKRIRKMPMIKLGIGRVRVKQPRVAAAQRPLCAQRRVRKRQLAVTLINLDLAAVLKLAEQNLVRQDPFDLVLNQSCHRPRTKGWIVTFVREPAPGSRRQAQEHLPIVELMIQFNDKFIDHSLDIFPA